MTISDIELARAARTIWEKSVERLDCLLCGESCHRKSFKLHLKNRHGWRYHAEFDRNFPSPECEMNDEA
jgi:hypothetical protein